MEKKDKIPLLTNMLEESEISFQCVKIWKRKNIVLTEGNCEDNIYVTSFDLASLLNMRHSYLINKNILILLSKGHLNDHVQIYLHIVKIGSKSQRLQKVYCFKISEINTVLLSIQNEKVLDIKLNFAKFLQNAKNEILQNIENKDIIEIDKIKSSSLALLEDILELHSVTFEGIQIWKRKGILLSPENVQDNVFILSNQLSEIFEIRHDNLIVRNIIKLQREHFLPDHLLKFEEMVDIGSQSKRKRLVYALTKKQAYHVIMDFMGVKAQKKKHDIVDRLDAIESDVLKGLYQEARIKASSWDGVQLIKDMGLKTQVENFATRQEIADFLKVRMCVLQNFLHKYSHIIEPSKLTPEQKKQAGIKAGHIHFYSPANVLRIVFWMDSTKGVEFKQKLLGDLGLYARPDHSLETGWKAILEQVFDGLGLHFNYRIDSYLVDVYVRKLHLVLECDSDDHKNYDQKKEVKRDKRILKEFALIRFNPKTKLETLLNAILKAEKHKITRLYPT